MEPVHSPLFSIVVLTFNRKEILLELLNELRRVQGKDVELIIVDNGSEDGTAGMIPERFPEVKLVALSENRGAVARNQGMRVARGHYVVTIDDDILGLNSAALEAIDGLFHEKPAMGALCFKVEDYYSGHVCNWCHPNKYEDSADQPFETCEITEGAVAFRKSVLEKTGLYTEEMFISHEGADLAARMIHEGCEIHYTPRVIVRHKYAAQARDRWRRYYYDTRNDFWLAIRNYRFTSAMHHLLRRLPVTFIYSVRDGYTLYWFKAVKDAFLDLPKILRQRRAISVTAQRKIRRLSANKPGIIYYFQKRFLAKQVRI